MTVLHSVLFSVLETIVSYEDKEKGYFFVGVLLLHIEIYLSNEKLNQFILHVIYYCASVLNGKKIEINRKSDERIDEFRRILVNFIAIVFFPLSFCRFLGHGNETRVLIIVITIPNSMQNILMASQTKMHAI